MADNKIALEVSLETSDVNSGFIKIEKRAKDAGAKVGKDLGEGLSDKFNDSVSSLKNQLIGLAAAFLGFSAIKGAIKQATDAEAAINGFNAALAQQGVLTAQASESFLAYADSLKEVTGVDDDLIIQNAALLVSLGRLSGEGLERATAAALDLAAGLQIDVGSAFDLVAKAASGNVGALGRYGIKVGEVGTASEKFARSLDLIGEKFGGLAEARALTFQGTIDRLSNSFDDAQKAFGRLFTNDPVVKEFLQVLVETFNKLTGSLDKVGQSRNVVGELIILLVQVGEAVNKFVVAPFEILGNAVTATFFLIRQRLQEWVIQPLADFAGALGEFGKKFDIKDSITAPLIAFRDVAKDTTIEVQQDFLTALDNIANVNITGSTAVFLEDLRLRLQAVNVEAVETGASLKNNLVSAAQEIDLASQQISLSFEGVMAGIKASAKTVNITFKELGNTLLNGFANAAGQAFASFGKALRKGENATAAFFDSFLASVANMAVQVGTQFILQGIALSIIEPGKGTAMIGAGAALAAFGGFLSASVGGDTEAAGAGGGGGTSGGFAPATGDTFTPDDLEQTQPNTEIVVNVEGNILDRRETGLFISEVIRENIETQGLIIGGQV